MSNICCTILAAEQPPSYRSPRMRRKLAIDLVLGVAQALFQSDCTPIPSRWRRDSTKQSLFELFSCRTGGPVWKTTWLWRGKIPSADMDGWIKVIIRRNCNKALTPILSHRRHVSSLWLNRRSDCYNNVTWRWRNLTSRMSHVWEFIIDAFCNSSYLEGKNTFSHLAPTPMSI